MTTKCPVCGTSVEAAHGIDYQGRLWMYQCPGCAFAFVHPPPSFSATAEVYEDAYTADPKAELKTRRLAQDYLRKIRPFVPEHCAFLEIGGSHGWLSEAIQKTTHADVTMVEPGRTADDIAKEQKQFNDKIRQAQEHRASREKSNNEKSGTSPKPLPESP